MVASILNYTLPFVIIIRMTSSAAKKFLKNASGWSLHWAWTKCRNEAKIQEKVIHMSIEETKPTDFIREAVAEDLRTGRFNYVRTRLPPEPNGYLHIGHVKAFMIDYLIAKENNGELILRFDDTNPTREETEFVEAIEEDARWLGIEWKKVTFASDYFDELYDWAGRLVMMGKAYVDDQSPEEVSANRGTLTEPGKNSQSQSGEREKSWI